MPLLLIVLCAGLQIPLPASTFDHEVEPTCNRWPFMDEFDMMQVVMTNQQICSVLQVDWEALLVQQPPDDIAGVFGPFPPEADQVVDRQPTTAWAMPIMIDVGTASYADSKKRQQMVVDETGTKYHVQVGDLQTMQRDWWYNFMFLCV